MSQAYLCTKSFFRFKIVYQTLDNLSIKGHLVQVLYLGYAIMYDPENTNNLYFLGFRRDFRWTTLEGVQPVLWFNVTDQVEMIVSADDGLHRVFHV